MSIASLIIPTYNRQKIVLQTLDYLNNQAGKDFEIIVVDQTNLPEKQLTDFTPSDNSVNYKYINIEEIGLPNARNVGAEVSSADILIYIDDDCIPDPDMVRSYVKIFENLDSRTWCVAGRVIEKNNNIFRQSDKIVGGWITWYGKTLKNFDTDDKGECQWAPGGNFAVRKSRYQELSGFDINFIGNAMLEDADFGFKIIRNGGRVIYEPSPVMEHLRVTLGGTRRESSSKGMYYRSHNTIYFLRKHKLILRILPAVFYLAAVAFKDLIKRKHGPLAIFWAPIGIIRGFFTKIQ